MPNKAMNAARQKHVQRLTTSMEKPSMAITASALHPSNMHVRLKYFVEPLAVMKLVPSAWGGLLLILTYTVRALVVSYF